MIISLGLTGDLGVVVQKIFSPLLGSHVIAERVQQVLLAEALLLLSFAKTEKNTRTHISLAAYSPVYLSTVEVFKDNIIGSFHFVFLLCNYETIANN